MQETIRQHYVPRTYLKHFGKPKDGKYFIGFIPAETMSLTALREINIENICVEKHIYTLPGATTTERMWLENLYSEVFERNYDKVYEMLVDPKKRTLTQNERSFIISTVVSMYYRTPNWNNSYFRFMDSVIERGYALAKSSTYDHFMLGEEKLSIAGKTVEELKKERREMYKPMVILSQLRSAMKLINLRSYSDSIMVAKLEDGPDEFITSDNPVTCNNIEEGDIMPIDPTNMLTLPIDAKHQLTLMPHEEKERHLAIHRSTYARDIAMFPKLACNWGQEKNAVRFLLGSQIGIKDYFKEKELVENKNPDEKTKRFKKIIETLNDVL